MLMSSQNSLETLVKHSANIYNDETNLSDNPDIKRCIFKRGVKYPERVINASKSMTSVKYCASAMGDILPHILCTKLKVFGIVGFLEVLMVPGITGPRKAGLMQPASVIGSRVTFCQMCAIYLDLSSSSVITYRVTSVTMSLYSQKSKI